MSSLISTFPRVSVSVRRDEQEHSFMTPVKVKDETWKFLDDAGHLHSWVNGVLVTCKRVQTGTTFVGDEFDGEEIAIFEERCTICEEVIEPGYRTTYQKPSFVALTWIELEIDNGDSIETFSLTPEQYEKGIRLWAKVLVEAGFPHSVSIQ